MATGTHPPRKHDYRPHLSINPHIRSSQKLSTSTELCIFSSCVPQSAHDKVKCAEPLYGANAPKILPRHKQPNHGKPVTCPKEARAYPVLCNYFTNF